MAQQIRLYDNYPVRFNLVEDDCIDYDNRNFKQIANLDDTLTFFWQASQCGDNLLPLSTFKYTNQNEETAIYSNWLMYGYRLLQTTDYNYPGLIADPSVPGANFQPSNLALLDSGYYKISFTVKSQYENGAINGSVYCSVGAVTLNSDDGIITNEGTYSFYINNPTSNIAAYARIYSGDGFDGIISDITLYKYNTDYKVAIKRCDDNTWDLTNMLYVYESTDINQVIPTQRNWSNKQIDLFWFSKTWRQILQGSKIGSDQNDELSANLPSYFAYTGCYEICLFDGCTYDFDAIVYKLATDNTWSTSGSGWAFNVDRWCHSVGAIGTLYQDIPTLNINKSYKVIVTVTGRTFGTLAVYLAGQTTDSNGYISADGTYQYLFTPQGGNTELRLIASAEFNGCVTFVDVYEAAEVQTPVSCSECYSVAESHTCSKLISYWNEDDAFGVPWSVVNNDVYAPLANDDPRFKIYMRLECDLYKAKYIQNQDEYKNSAGVKEITYFDARKQKELIINEMPEYMHDAVALAKGHDHFYIDGVEYIAEAGYEPEWQEKPRLKMARSRFLVEQKTYKMTNKKC